ncbi:hypothetical protein BN2127_JRS1_00976 [Bacillus cereus]|uniref:hypothetical protein n=1 Tax=Bacillus thuringiensis TaxID=1428 RepID=UPI0006A910EB|nr:hypothetical protein [Bacillus thuringiensis]PEF03555.1 hypothetical protein COM97_26465 [Bacillus thuringiensis]CUB09192.1 hypothetical protein BN2127_JRS1_00976 [Bacillus cereus]
MKKKTELFGKHVEVNGGVFAGHKGLVLDGYNSGVEMLYIVEIDALDLQTIIQEKHVSPIDRPTNIPFVN